MILGASLALAAAAQQIDMPAFGEVGGTLPYGKVGAWHIRIDLSAERPACYATAMYEGDIAIRVTYSGETDINRRLLMIVADRFAELPLESEVPVIFAFGQNDPWYGQGVALQMDNGEYFVSVWLEDDAIFAEEMAEAYDAEMVVNGEPAGEFDLRGSKAAIARMDQCQAWATRFNFQPDSPSPITTSPS